MKLFLHAYENTFRLVIQYFIERKHVDSSSLIYWIIRQLSKTMEKCLIKNAIVSEFDMLQSFPTIGNQWIGKYQSIAINFHCFICIVEHHTLTIKECDFVKITSFIRNCGVLLVYQWAKIKNIEVAVLQFQTFWQPAKLLFVEICEAFCILHALFCSVMERRNEKLPFACIILQQRYNFVGK